MRLFQSRHNQRSLVRNCEHYLETMMSEETTTEPNVMAGDVITQPGLYESRGGDIMPIIGWGEGWWVSEWNGTRDWYGSDGRQRFRSDPEKGQWDLERWVAPLPASEVEPEPQPQPQPQSQPQSQPIQVCEGRWKTRGGDIRDVTPTPEDDGRGERWPWWDAHSKQTWRADGRAYLAAESVLDLVTYLGPIEPDKTQELPAEYASPDGWRLLEAGETLTLGDEIVQLDDGRRYPTERVGSTVGANQRYIRRIEQQPEPQPQPEAQPEPEPEPPMLQDADQRITLLKTASHAQAETILRLQGEARDLNIEIGGLERQLVLRGAQIYNLETLHAAASQAVVDAGKANDKLRAQADELQSEIHYLQKELGSEKLRVVELEELVVSLRTINDAAEKAIDSAGKENTALRLQLAVAKAELTTAAAVSLQLQIELDAAQQVPTDSPELRRAWRDLAEVTRERDQYRDAYDRILADLQTIRETTTADTVEAIVEWLQPFRGCNSPSLALLLIESLPHIMRSLTGLADEEIE